MLVVALLTWAGSGRSISARFAFDERTFEETPADVAAALGGPLTTAEAETIRRVARAEVREAFDGLRIRFTDEGRAFWKVWVVPQLAAADPRGRPRRNAAGAAYTFGMLGGAAFINFRTLALKAVIYAPPGASREQVVEAIARGIAGSAIHEFAHLALGAAPIHSKDEGVYEYEQADRASQFYGRLKWGPARPLLERRLGRPPSQR